MASRPFKELFAIPLRNGLTKPKAVRGAGTKMVNMGELFANPRIVNVAMDRVPLNQAERSSSLLAAGDLLFARQSLVLSGAGKCSIFVRDDENVCFESHVIRCRVSQELADPHFYYYFFSSPAGRALMESIVEQGAGASGIRGSDLAELSVPWIDPIFQRRVAGVLSQIDDKISFNRRIIQTLEAMAQAIFQSWFVDFDPVKAKIAAKAEGRDPLRAAMSAISGKADAELDALPPEAFDQLAATAALFPDEMQESELGEIPRGWMVESLSKMIQLIGGGTPKRSESAYWGGNVLWYSVKDAPCDGDVWAVDTQEKITNLGLQKSSTKLLTIGTTIISARGTVGKLALVGKEMAMNQSCYGVAGADGIGSYFNYFNLKEAVETLKRNVHGAVFDTITQATFETVSRIRPLNEQHEAFEQQVRPLLEEVLARVVQNRTLNVLRDTLLPKLLSGELSVEAITELARAA